MRRGLALLALLLLTACAPQFQQIGPADDPPALTATAFHTADGVDLPLRIWLPPQEPERSDPKAVVLALHGFNDYSAGLALPGHGLARRGFAVYAYDQRGFGRAPQHGIWPGSEQFVTDLKSATLLLKQKYTGKPIFLLGESMGAAVIMAAAVEPDAPKVDGMILVSPAIWGWQTQSAFNRDVVDLAAHAVPWLTVVPTGLRVEATDNRQALIALSRDPLVIKQTRVDAAYGLVDLMTRAYAAIPKLGSPRYLMLYGGNEQILNKGAVADAIRSLPPLPPDQARLAVYPNGYHLLLRDWDAPRIYDDIASWIDHPDRPLPSGADARGRKSEDKGQLVEKQN